MNGKRDLEEDIILRKTMWRLMRRSTTKLKLPPPDVVELSADELERALNTYKIVVVDLYTSWCPPCQVYKGIFEQVARDNKGIALFSRVNLDKNPEVAIKYDVTSVPTTLIFVGGKLVRELIGLLPRHILNRELRNVIGYTRR